MSAAKRGRPKVIEGDVERVSLSIGDVERRAVARWRLSFPGAKVGDALRGIIAAWLDLDTPNATLPSRKRGRNSAG